MFDTDKDYPIDKNATVLNKLLILHAEHEQNCSTATVRNIASAGGDVYTAIASGISAFKGKLHGGASQYVAEIYNEILENNYDVDYYVDEKIRNKKRLMGFGHRVYNCWDPRAKIMFNMLNSNEYDSPKIDKYKNLVLKLINKAGRDEFFIQRNIYPNPDLLNCIFFKLIGVPFSMNTVMLSLSRIAGWLAHYYEHLKDKQPIIRPRQIAKVNGDV